MSNVLLFVGLMFYLIPQGAEEERKMKKQKEARKQISRYVLVVHSCRDIYFPCVVDVVYHVTISASGQLDI